MESFESAGLWWLPDTPNERVVGLLKYSDSEGFRLSIPFGHLGGMKNMAARVNEAKNTPLARGVLRNGKHVTLVNLFMTNMTMNMPGAGSEEYLAGLGFIGPAEVDGDPDVDRARIAYSHLRDWVVGYPGVSQHAITDGSLGRGVDYHYESPEPEELAAGDGWTLSLVHTASLPFASLTGFNLSHDCELELRLESPLGFEQLSKTFLGPFWQFFAFCLDIDIDTTILRIHLASNDDWIDVGRHHRLSKSTGKVILPQFMLLSRPQLDSRIGQVLLAWMGATDDERRAISLLVGLLGDRSVAGDLQFLVAAQGLEALARVDAREYELEAEEFKRRRILALEPIEDSKVKKWVARKLENSNERSASELLRDLMVYIGGYVNVIAPDREKLLEDIRYNRNFYTHRDDRRAKRVLEGEELYVLTQAIVLLLKAAVLRRLGFSEDETSAIMEGSQGALQLRFRIAKQYRVTDEALA